MIKKILLGFLGSILILIILILVQSVDPVQVDIKATNFQFPDSLSNHSFDLDSLYQIVGSNKKVPPGFEVAALLAFSAYPELKDANIEMILTLEGAPMESNFDIPTLFGQKKDRVYQVLLNNAENTIFDEILLRSLPFDAQVGILAHELGHVAYYDQLSTLQIAKWGLMYLVSDEFRAKHEKSTDMMPVYHGLGSQIYQYAYFVRHDPSCRDLYESFGAEFIDKYYMTDIELLKAIEER